MTECSFLGVDGGKCVVFFLFPYFLPSLLCLCFFPCPHTTSLHVFLHFRFSLLFSGFFSFEFILQYIFSPLLCSNFLFLSLRSFPSPLCLFWRLTFSPLNSFCCFQNEAVVSCFSVCVSLCVFLCVCFSVCVSLYDASYLLSLPFSLLPSLSLSLPSRACLCSPKECERRMSYRERHHERERESVCLCALTFPLLSCFHWFLSPWGFIFSLCLFFPIPIPFFSSIFPPPPVPKLKRNVLGKSYRLHI